jgi:hypothetical protein
MHFTSHVDRNLWYGSLLTTGFLASALIVATASYGVDPVMIVVSLLSVIALVGVWRQSAVGKAFLGILIIAEAFYLITSGLALFGAAALAGQGFSAVDRLMIVLLIAIALTVLPLGLFTTFLNRASSARPKLPDEHNSA